MQQRLHQMCLGPASSSMTASTPVSEQWNDIPDPDNLERSGFEANFHYSEIEQAGGNLLHVIYQEQYNNNNNIMYSYFPQISALITLAVPVTRVAEKLIRPFSS